MTLETMLINFLLVIVGQLVFLLIQTKTLGLFRELPKYLLLGITIGVPFGVIFDLLVGKTLGVFSYEIGFVWWFLVINGAFSYGFMIANTCLLFRHRLASVYQWSIGLAVYYELLNWLFPVWSWELFSAPAANYIFMILLGYIALAWLMMVCLRLIAGLRFRPLPF
jgi:hypothetical protein